MPEATLITSSPSVEVQAQRNTSDRRHPHHGLEFVGRNVQFAVTEASWGPLFRCHTEADSKPLRGMKRSPTEGCQNKWAASNTTRSNRRESSPPSRSRTRPPTIVWKYNVSPQDELQIPSATYKDHGGHALSNGYLQHPGKSQG